MWWLREPEPCLSARARAQVDTAYDVLLMQSLTKRRSGVVTDSRVKFADVPRPVKVRHVPLDTSPHARYACCTALEAASRTVSRIHSYG